MSLKDQYRIFVPSREPVDKKYIDFINAVDLGVAIVGDGGLKPIGKDFSFSRN